MNASPARWHARLALARPWVAAVLLCTALLGAAVPAAAAPAEAPRRQADASDARLSAAPVLERALQGHSAEGARVLAWGRRGAPEKIVVEGLGERGRTLQSFYWQRGVLVASHLQRIDYGAHILELPKDRPTPR